MAEERKGGEQMQEEGLLLEACEAGDSGEVVRLLQVDGIDVNVQNANGWTALMYASRYGHAEVVERLLQADEIEVNLQNAYEWTALMQASQYGHAEVVNKLVQTKKPNVDAQREGGWTALMSASCDGYTEVVEQLLQVDEINVNLQNANGWTALMHASQYGHAEVVKKLVQTEKPNVDAQREGGWTALMSASRDGYTEVVEQLLQVDEINVNLQNANGWTALMHASRRGHAAVVERLLQVDGIDLDLCAGDGSTVLHAAADWWYYHNAPETAWIVALIRKAPHLLTIVDNNQRMPLTRLDGCPALDVLDELELPKNAEYLHLAPPQSLKVHLCGPGGAGKSMMRATLVNDAETVRALKVAQQAGARGTYHSTRTLAAEVHTLVGNPDLHLFDHGGQREFHVMHHSVVSAQHPCIALIVLPTSFRQAFEGAIPDGEQEAELDDWLVKVKQQLLYWLSFVYARSHENSIVAVVCNHRHVPHMPSGETAHRVTYIKELVERQRRKASDAGPLPSLHTVVLPMDPQIEDDGVCLDVGSVSTFLEDEGQRLVQQVRQPKLCVEASQIVRRFYGEDRIVVPMSEFTTVITERFEGLGDAHAVALAWFLEGCGEAMYISESSEPHADDDGTQPLSWLITNPHVFCSKVLGPLFAPDGLLRARREPLQVRTDVSYSASVFVTREQLEELVQTGAAFFDGNLDVLPRILEGMGLILPNGANVRRGNALTDTDTGTGTGADTDMSDRTTESNTWLPLFRLADVYLTDDAIRRALNPPHHAPPNQVWVRVGRRLQRGADRFKAVLFDTFPCVQSRVFQAFHKGTPDVSAFTFTFWHDAVVMESKAPSLPTRVVLRTVSTSEGVEALDVYVTGVLDSSDELRQFAGGGVTSIVAEDDPPQHRVSLKTTRPQHRLRALTESTLGVVSSSVAGDREPAIMGLVVVCLDMETPSLSELLEGVHSLPFEELQRISQSADDQRVANGAVVAGHHNHLLADLTASAGKIPTASTPTEDELPPGVSDDSKQGDRDGLPPPGEPPTIHRKTAAGHYEYRIMLSQDDSQGPVWLRYSVCEKMRQYVLDNTEFNEIPEVELPPANLKELFLIREETHYELAKHRAPRLVCYFNHCARDSFAAQAMKEFLRSQTLWSTKDLQKWITRRQKCRLVEASLQTVGVIPGLGGAADLFIKVMSCVEEAVDVWEKAEETMSEMEQIMGMLQELERLLASYPEDNSVLRGMATRQTHRCAEEVSELAPAFGNMVADIANGNLLAMFQHHDVRKLLDLIKKRLREAVGYTTLDLGFRTHETVLGMAQDLKEIKDSCPPGQR